ncbi:MAG: hypothetical protein ACJ735_09825 [Actinomycetes bacterium]
MTDRKHRRSAAVVALALGLGGLVVALNAPALASTGSSTPPSGTVGPANNSAASWTFDDVQGAGLGGTPIEVACAPVQCSKYALTVKLPQPDATFYQNYVATLTFHCAWNSSVPTDADCFAFSPAGNETGPGRPDTDNAGPNYEDITVNNPQSGVWSLRADAGASVPQPTSITGHVTLTYAKVAKPPAIEHLRSDAKFTNYDFSTAYQTRDGLHRPNAGEPSVGVNWATGNVMFMAGTQMTRLTYNHLRPPTPTPTDVTPGVQVGGQDAILNEDAILFTDRETHRTWALGLLLAGSYEFYSDDDGAHWTPAVAISVPALPDHETLGSGPYHSPAPAHTYPHAVYYCAQTIVEDAYCGRSDDGGVKFATVASALWHGQCTAIHGHVRVGPTGLVYVPNGSCTDASGKPRSGVAVSADNGQSFTVSTIPDSSPGTSDPSVMEGPDGIVYFGYQAASGHPMLATATHDAAGHLHWRPSVDVGQFADPGETEDGLVHGVQNTEFAEVITGDKGRAAFAFLGTGTQGAYQDGAFPGTWYLFVSYTFDGGKTWRTVNATPGDPVQRGCVWNGGLVNACRNMLDFNDIGVDKQGHVYVAYTDGCTTTADYSCDKTRGIHGWNNLTSGENVGGCPPSQLSTVTSSSTCTFARVSAVVRQVCGRGLIAASDPGFKEAPSCAQAASVTEPTVSKPLATTGSRAPWSAVFITGTALLGAVWLRRRRRRMPS